MNLVQSSPGEIVFFSAVMLLFCGAMLLFVAPRWLHSGRPDWALALFVSVVGTLLMLGWVAVVLALVGQYSLGLLTVVLVGIGAVLVVTAGRFGSGLQAFERGSWHELGLVVLLVTGALLYFQPHEYVLGGSDAGSYINTAATTARTGSYLQTSEWNRFLAENADVALRSQPPPFRTRHLQFVGWYFDDSDPSLVRPQFFPFHPVLLSVAMSLGGVAAGFLVTPLAAVLSIAALYFLARQLFGKTVALLSALFLTITSTQIFFGRYPTTEPLTLLLLFSGFLSFQILWDETDAAPAWGVFGGAALGAALLTRIDLPLVVTVIIATLLLRLWLRRWSRAWSAFAATFLLFVLQLVIVGWLFVWPYVWNTYSSVFMLLSRSIWLASAAAITVLAVSVAAILLGSERLRAQMQRQEISKAVRWSLAILLIALSLYAYFLRPVLEPLRMATSWPGDTQFPILNGQNWVRLGWYLTPLGIGLATAGIAMMVVRERLTRLVVVIGIGVFTIFQYVYNIMNTPYHIYAMRRYVPIVIPMLWIFAAYAITSLPRFSRPWMTYTLRGVFVLALVGGLVYQDRYVTPARDFAGSLRQVNELQQRLRPDAIVLIAEPSEALFADAFGAPLQAFFDHPIATVRIGRELDENSDSAEARQSAAQTVEFLDKLKSFAVGQERPIQLLAVEPIPSIVRNHLALQPVNDYRFTTQMLMNTYDDFPSVTQIVHYGIEIYDVMTNEDEQTGSDAVEVDIGSIDAAYLDSGFYAKEYIPGAPTMRWTEESAKLTVPMPQSGMADGSQHWDLQVRAMIYRPEGIEPAQVVVNVNNQEVGSFIPTEAWTTFVFPVSEAIISTTHSVQIQFATDAFVPATVGVNNDQRSLGFLIDWIRLAPASLQPER
ncbi:MAG: glycosyltransferase family 39 protein [Caldilineaceae bacterium]|nr:glycosyltransferase family 39 protein [Caldilineaceae bacterium]